MNGSGREVVLEYHEATKHSPASLRRPRWFMDWSNKPAPLKRYRQAEQIELPTVVRPGRVSALDAIAQVEGGGDLTDVEALARLLLLGAGIHHTVRYTDGEVWHFRTYASAGALYPNELYVACDRLDGLDAGVYHFQPGGPALVRLREGDHRAQVVRAGRGDPAVAHARVVLVLTGIPWRTSWKYAERGYRHVFWDGGMIVANLLALAASAEIAAHVAVGFADGELEALLGLDGRREFPVCLVGLGSTDRSVDAAPDPPETIGQDVSPLSRTEHVFELITRTNDAGRLDTPEEVARWRDRGEAGWRETEAKAAPIRDPIEEVIARRGSARRFGSIAMPRAVLEDVLARAAQGIPSDYAPGARRLAEPYLIANRIDGLERGAYVWREGALRHLAAGDLRDRAAFICLEQPIGGTSAATVFLMTDLAEVLDRLGARGYRAALLEAGIVAGRLYLGAYAHRFGATGLTFYDDEVEATFAPDAAGKSCMLVVAIGDSPRLRRPDSA